MSQSVQENENNLHTAKSHIRMVFGDFVQYTSSLPPRSPLYLYLSVSVARSSLSSLHRRRSTA